MHDEDQHASHRDAKRRARRKMGVDGRSVFLIEELQRAKKGPRPQRGGIREIPEPEEEEDER